MASLASRSVDKSKFDGLLVRAAELCAIVRTSYLSPSFPFLLCFELWQYLRRQLPEGDPSGPARHGRRPRRKEASSTAGSPLTLRLLRAAAFAVTLMLPAEGWAQFQTAAPAEAGGSHQTRRGEIYGFLGLPPLRIGARHPTGRRRLGCKA